MRNVFAPWKTCVVSETKRQGGEIKKILQQGCGWLKRLLSPPPPPNSLTSPKIGIDFPNSSARKWQGLLSSLCRQGCCIFVLSRVRSVYSYKGNRPGWISFNYLLFAKTVIRHCRKLFNSQGQKLVRGSHLWCVSLSAWYFGCSHMCILFCPVCCVLCCAAFIFLFVI